MKIGLAMLIGVALAAGISLGGAFIGERVGVMANTEATAGPAAVDVCTTQT
jgi:hypothetical protein